MGAKEGFYHWLEVMFEENLRELQATQDELNELYSQRVDMHPRSAEFHDPRVRELAISRLELLLKDSQADFGRSIWNIYLHDKKASKQ